MGTLLKILDASLVIVGLWIVQAFVARRRRLPVPPGPKGLPVIGNMLDMPTSKEWLTFARWGERYGDIASVNILGQLYIIVNSSKVAEEMLEKRSSIYSDRPVMQMGGELVGWKNTLVLVPYGNRFRSYRRLAHQLFGSYATMKQFLPTEEQETHRFLQRILASPKDFSSHIRKTAGAIILRISHGYKVEEGSDPFVTLADLATEQFSLSTSPGVFIVNLFPLLRHVPSWFPGAGFHTTAREWSATLQEMVQQPFSYVKAHMAAGTAEDSFTSRLLSEQPAGPDREFDIKWCAASLYSGGADTTVSAIHAFFKAMALFPEVQAKAQQELDSVVGSQRLPGFSDRGNLPYVNALALEVLRWHSVTPTGVPHRVIEDDVYQGYFIPKGSLVLTNIWKMTHDESIYHEPMKFDPERFLGQAPEPDPRSKSFGFGRRICPGRILADASVFISCAMTLAVFTISKYNEGGKVFVPDLEQSTGTISHPSEFKCSIQPRSAKAILLIQSD